MTEACKLICAILMNTHTHTHAYMHIYTHAYCTHKHLIIIPVYTQTNTHTCILSLQESSADGVSTFTDVQLQGGTEDLTPMLHALLADSPAPNAIVEGILAINWLDLPPMCTLTLNFQVRRIMQSTAIYLQVLLFFFAA